MHHVQDSFQESCSIIPACTFLTILCCLEPALLLGDVRCLNPVMRSQLLDGYREVVADGAFRKEERCSDLGNTCSARGGCQYIALPLGERIITFTERRHGKGGIDDPLASHSSPDSRRKLGRWRILEQKTSDSALHRLSQIARTPKRRQDEDAARRQLCVECGGGCNAITSWHLDVQ